MRVMLDTNILISSKIADDFNSVLSSQIIEELQMVINPRKGGKEAG